MINLVRSELLKLRTTHIWWVMLLATVLLGLAGTAANVANSNFALHPTTPPNLDPQGVPVEGTGGTAIPPSADVVLKAAAAVYTSGQLFGLLLVMVMGILIITNEYRHKTATVTFLAEPRRQRVVGAKLGVAVFWGAISCIAIAVFAIPIGAYFLSSWDVGTHLGDRLIIQTILLNALGFGIWAIFGLGLGTVLKNQIAAIVVGLVLYLGQYLIAGLLLSLASATHTDWIANVPDWLPAGASAIMTSPVQEPGHPAWWAGALALLAYGVLTAGFGTAVTVRRDIS
jgi:ABC-2 type transport system permease protein